MSTLKDFGFEEVKIIGRGQYGKARLVRAEKEKSCCVAKTIDLTCLSSKERETALQEVALLRRLDHPNIVEYKDSFFMAETLVIIMQYCEGGDLQSYIKDKFREKQRILEVQIMHYFAQILQALLYMHGEHILHRDLKTSNIFLMKSKRVVKLGDFGISRVLEGSIEAAMTVVGTPYYMSPEVCENKPYAFKSDVWSLGCVLYELCMLKHAFSADNLLGLVYKIVSDKYEPIPGMYSSALNVLIQRMLEKDATKRPCVRDLLGDAYVQGFMNEYVRTGGRVPTVTRAGATKGDVKQQSTSSIPPYPKTKSGGRMPGQGRPGETPKEAAARRKREIADRQAAELKSAASQAGRSRLVARRMKETEFQTTRAIACSTSVAAKSTCALAGDAELKSRDISCDEEFVDGDSASLSGERDQGFESLSEDISSYSSQSVEDGDDCTEYEDDFVSEDEDDGRSDAPIDPIPASSAAREEQDFGRVMANYGICSSAFPATPMQTASANESRRVMSRIPSSETTWVPAGSPRGSLRAHSKPSGGNQVMDLNSRADKLRHELVQKMGKTVFQKAFDYLSNARRQKLEERTVRRELEALVGRDVYKRFCFDVDQLVFQQMIYT